MSQQEIPATVMRGGSSRGVFLAAQALPEPGPERDLTLTRLLGSPDPLQIDGLGGTFSSNSKAMIVDQDAGPDYDIGYVFCQVAVEEARVHYAGNCGNLAAAVAPFAIDTGLVPAREPATTVTMLNRNTGVRMRGTVPVRDGAARVHGSTRLPGLPYPGVSLAVEYLDPGGSVLGSTLPTGAVLDEVEVPGLGNVTFSLVDVTSPVAFVDAAAVGLTGHEQPQWVNADHQLLRTVEAVRGACAVRAGLATTLSEAQRDSPVQPKLAIIAAPAPDDRATGDTSLGDEAGGVPAAHLSTLTARIFSMGRMHHAFTVTGLLCLAAAASIPGTIPSRRRTTGPTGAIRVRHARGTTDVAADVVNTDDGPCVPRVVIERTARTIMRGTAFVDAS